MSNHLTELGGGILTEINGDLAALKCSELSLQCKVRANQTRNIANAGYNNNCSSEEVRVFSSLLPLY